MLSVIWEEPAGQTLVLAAPSTYAAAHAHMCQYATHSAGAVPQRYRVGLFYLPAEHLVGTYWPAEYPVSTESISTASVPISAPREFPRAVPCEYSGRIL